MANPKSSGSGPGVEDARPPALPNAEVPTLEVIAELAERLAANIAFMRGAASAEQIPPAMADTAPPTSDTDKAKERGEDDGEDDDDQDDGGLGVDDTARNGGPWGYPPLKCMIEGHRTRLDLADSILAGVDADLEADHLHLEGQRLSNGNHKDVICHVRRILQKSVAELDNTVVRPLVEKSVATALEMHAKGEKDFDPYDDTPEVHANKRAAAERLAAQQERPASGS